MADQVETLPVKQFRDQKRRACLVETEACSTLGKVFDISARKCQYFKPNSVLITDTDRKPTPINECLHPDKHLKLTEFCQPLVDHINERYS